MFLGFKHRGSKASYVGWGSATPSPSNATYSFSDDWWKGVPARSNFEIHPSILQGNSWLHWPATMGGSSLLDQGLWVWSDSWWQFRVENVLWSTFLDLLALTGGIHTKQELHLAWSRHSSALAVTVCLARSCVCLHVKIWCSLLHLFAAVLQDNFERTGVIVVTPLILYKTCDT